MVHTQQKFLFADKAQKQVEFLSKKFCFEVEKIFIEMIGREKYQQYQKDKTVDLEINLDKVKTYFPLLLDAPTEKYIWSKIDWAKQDYDNILSVVTFFLQYKKNATLRQLKSETDTVASVIQVIQKLSNLKLENILNQNSLQNIPSSSLQENQLENSTI